MIAPDTLIPLTACLRPHKQPCLSCVAVVIDGTLTACEHCKPELERVRAWAKAQPYCDQCGEPDSVCKCQDSWRPMTGGVNVYPFALVAMLLLSGCHGHLSSPLEWFDTLPQCIQAMMAITVVGCSVPLGLWAYTLMFERHRTQRGWGFDPHEDTKFIIEHSIDEPDASAESNEPVTFLTRTGEPLLVSPAVHRKLLALRTKLTVHAPTNSQPTSPIH